MAVAGVLIASAITGATALLIEALRDQGIQHEQVLGIQATVRRIEQRLERIETRLEQTYSHGQAEQDLAVQRAAIDHNWSVIQRLRVRLQTVEHTLWPPKNAWREADGE